MKEFKGTKGVWALGDENNQSHEVCLGETTATVDLSRFGRFGEGFVMGRDEMRANAYLISASPELLAALQACVSLIESELLPGGKDLNEYKIAISAINKALGIKE